MIATISGTTLRLLFSSADRLSRITVLEKSTSLRCKALIISVVKLTDTDPFRSPTQKSIDKTATSRSGSNLNLYFVIIIET